MVYVRQFSVDTDTHPKTIEQLEKWKKQRINISRKICQIIDTEAMKEEEKEGSNGNNNG